MSKRPVVPREIARRDIDNAITYYLSEGGAEIALAFIDSLENALENIARHPSAGSPRYAHELALPGLRYRLLKRFPYLVFYVERTGHIDVWRVLHAKRDVPGAIDESQT